MFVITAKVSGRKLTAAALALIVVAAILVLALGGRGDAEEASSMTAVVANREERMEYLRSLGWEVGEELEEQSITIPRKFGQVYGDYNELQRSQGFDLANYAGLSATRYTYSILNYPGAAETVVADIIVYRNQVIAGDVQSVAADGFMSGLAYPR